MADYGIWHKKERENHLMIGFYDYTVILTYGGLILSILGIFETFKGNPVGALLYLGLALVCDTLDGKVASTKKDRTRAQTMFGIQIDSLCDMVSFGVMPAIFCYCNGMNKAADIVLISYYCLCGVIRLAYFNVLAADKTPGEKSVYHGLPVVGFAIGLPVFYLFSLWCSPETVTWILRVALPATGTLYILNFRMPKPKLIMLLPLLIMYVTAFVLLCVYG